MKVLLVTHECFLSYSVDGKTLVRDERPVGQSVLAYLRNSNHVAVLLNGIQEDPLKVACEVRRADEFRSLTVGLLGKEEPVLSNFPTDDAGNLEFALWVRNLWTIAGGFRGDSRRFVIDQRARQITIGRQYTACSPQEFRLLLLFLRCPDIVFSRDELMRHVRTSASVVDRRLVDVLVGRLRRKIEQNPLAPSHIQTVPGFGYLFKNDHDMFIDAETAKPFPAWTYDGTS